MRSGTRMLDEHLEKSDGLPRTPQRISPLRSPMQGSPGSSTAGATSPRFNAAFSGSVTALQAELVRARREKARLSSRLSRRDGREGTPLRRHSAALRSEMVVMGKVNKTGRVESSSTRRVQG
jgi:hypothetical protein